MTEDELKVLDVDELVDLVAGGDGDATRVATYRLATEAMTEGERARLRRALAGGPSRRGWPPRGQVKAVLLRGLEKTYRLEVAGRSVEVDHVDVFDAEPLLGVRWTWNFKHAAGGLLRVEPVPVPPNCKEPRKPPPTLGGMGTTA